MQLVCSRVDEILQHAPVLANQIVWLPIIRNWHADLSGQTQGYDQSQYNSCVDPNFVMFSSTVAFLFVNWAEMPKPRQWVEFQQIFEL